jgi:hypothetical protein
MSSFGLWDSLYIVSVAALALGAVCLRPPESKALVFNLPIPFSLSFLAVGRPVDSSNVAALLLLLGYTRGIKLLHCGLRLPIVPAIGLSALGYSLAGAALARALPEAPGLFWGILLITFIIGVILYIRHPGRAEQAQCRTLPWFVRVPVVFAVSLGLISIKGLLEGFLTVFPVVGMIVAYETQQNLEIICRQTPVIILTVTPMLMAMRLAQARGSSGFALACGWLVFLLVFIPLIYYDFHKNAAKEANVKK